MAAKLIRDLQPGDRIQVLKPAGIARVRSCAMTVKTMTRRHGSTSGLPAGIAWVVVFEMLDGMARGQTLHDFAHPEDKIICP